jgi:hypothetical protein
VRLAQSEPRAQTKAEEEQEDEGEDGLGGGEHLYDDVDILKGINPEIGPLEAYELENAGERQCHGLTEVRQAGRTECSEVDTKRREKKPEQAQCGSLNGATVARDPAEQTVGQTLEPTADLPRVMHLTGEKEMLLLGHPLLAQGVAQCGAGFLGNLLGRNFLALFAA